MKEKKILDKEMSRRFFLGTSAALAAGGLLPTLSCGAKRERRSSVGSVPDSRFAGVQIGAITYSFRDLKGGLESVLKACVNAGLSSVELMGTGVEDYLGAPKNPIRRKPTVERPYTLHEREVMEQFQKDLRAWRRTKGTVERYGELRKKFRDAGVGIHIFKWLAGNSDDELDYSFKVAKALGAVGITAELTDENARLLGPVAERNGMYAILHNHFQYSEPGFNVDKMLDYSSANRLNFDVGHYFGSTGLNPADFIRKYHERIISLHLKDKTGPTNATQKNANQVWGQGETPLAEILLLLKKEKWPIYCDIELEYPVAPWSSSVKEVRTCMEYCRQILL